MNQPSPLPVHLHRPKLVISELVEDAELVLGLVHHGAEATCTAAIAARVEAEQAARPLVRVEVPEVAYERGFGPSWESAVRDAGTRDDDAALEVALPQFWNEVNQEAATASAELAEFSEVRSLARREGSQVSLRAAGDELQLGSGLQHAVSALALHTAQGFLYLVEAAGVFVTVAPIAGLHPDMPLSLVPGTTWLNVGALWLGTTAGLATANFVAIWMGRKAPTGLASVAVGTMATGGAAVVMAGALAAARWTNAVDEAALTTTQEAIGAGAMQLVMMLTTLVVGLGAALVGSWAGEARARASAAWSQARFHRRTRADYLRLEREAKGEIDALKKALRLPGVLSSAFERGVAQVRERRRAERAELEARCSRAASAWKLLNALSPSDLDLAVAHAIEFRPREPKDRKPEPSGQSVLGTLLPRRHS